MSVTRPILKERYEVIVVGAGIGGLSAATILAHEGVEVLVLEQGNRPGGCCTSFRAGDFHFDVAAPVLRGFGQVGFHVLRTLFDFAGQQIELIPRDSAYTLYFGEERIEFHRDWHAFTAELGALFPQSAGSILSLVRELERLYFALLDCGGPPKPPLDEPLSSRLGHMVLHPVSSYVLSRHRRISAERIFYRFLDDPLFRSFLEADLFYNTGYAMDELSALHAAQVVMDRHIGGTSYPIGSFQNIPNRLEKAIIENGGQVLYGTAVAEVLLDAGRAAGVHLAGGSTILANSVVVDCPAFELFGKMVPAGDLKPETRAWLESVEPNVGVVAAYLGVSESAIPEDFNPNTVLVPDPEREPHLFMSVSVPSLLDPNLAPEGFHALCAHMVTRPSIWRGDLSKEKYVELKDAECSRLLDGLDSLLPGLRDATVVERLATPLTFKRYTMRRGGAIGGPRASGHLLPTFLPGAVTDIGGLFLVGDSTFFGRGIEQAAASGIHGALALIRYMGGRAPRFEPGAESFVLETVPVRPEISWTGVVDTISAVLESHRCMQCEDAPCVSGCPAGVEIPTFIRRIVAADVTGASRAIRESTPLGAACGLLCPVERLCESRCLRAELDSPVKIGELEAFACGGSPGPEGWHEAFQGTRRERIAVVGCGPAGISCAYYLSLLGYGAEIIEASIEAGGLPALIPDFKLNRRSLEREVEGALGSGIEFRGNTTFGEDVNFESLSREGFRAVFLGTGLHSVRMPDIKGIDLPGVIDALSFLSAARRGVKRELTSRVAVVGEGDLAVDTARLCVELGAQEVFVVTPSEKGSLGAKADGVEAAEAGGIVFLALRNTVEVVGEGRVEGILAVPLTDGAPGVPATEGDRPPHFLEAGTVIIAGEREPEIELALYLAGHLKMNESGTVKIDPDTMITSRKGVFAGGDIVRGGGGTVVEACADGRRAALSMDRFLQRSGSAPASSEAEKPQPSPDGEAIS